MMTRRMWLTLMTLVLCGMVGSADDDGLGGTGGQQSEQVTASLTASGAQGSGEMTHSVQYTTAANNTVIKVYLWRWTNGAWYLETMVNPLQTITVASPSSGSGNGTISRTPGGIYTVTAEMERNGVVVARFLTAPSVTAP